jgi:hypothetical protein
MPGFRDDKKFVLLQAADLLAGEVRLTAERGRTPFGDDYLCRRMATSRYAKVMTADEFAQLSRHVFNESTAREALRRREACDD